MKRWSWCIHWLCVRYKLFLRLWLWWHRWVLNLQLHAYKVSYNSCALQWDHRLWCNEFQFLSASNNVRAVEICHLTPSCWILSTMGAKNFEETCGRLGHRNRCQRRYCRLLPCNWMSFQQQPSFKFHTKTKPPSQCTVQLNHATNQLCTEQHSSAQLSVSLFSLRVGLNCVIWYFRVFLFEGTRCKLSYSVTYYTYLSYICSVMLYISVFNFSFVLKWHFLWASNFGGIWPTVNHSQIFNTRYISTTGSGYGSKTGQVMG